MMLSTEGEILLACADAVAAMRAAEQSRRRNLRRLSGTLRIGAAPALWTARWSRTLRHFHRRWPDVSLEIAGSNFSQLASAVAARQFDCGLLPATGDAGSGFSLHGLGCAPAWCEQLMLIESRAVGSPAKVLGVLPGGAYHALLAPAIRLDVLGGITRIIDMSCTEILLANVISGRCCAVVPKSLLRTQRVWADIRATGLGEMDVYLLWNQQFQLPAVEALRGLLARRVCL